MTEQKKYEGIRLSPTSIITWKRCPREFYYNYVKKIPIPSNIHLIKGSIVHKILENFFRRYKDNLEEYIEEIYNGEIEKNKAGFEELKLPTEELEKEKQDCRNMVNIFLRNFRTKMDGLKWAGKAENDRHAFYLLKPKFREKFYESKDLNVCGFVDRIHTDFNGTTTIADYKTGSRYGVGIKDEYEIQSGIYALLHELNTGKRPDYTSIIFLRYGEEIRTRVTPDQIKNVLTTIKEVNTATRTDDVEVYPKNEGKFCKWCSYFSICSGMEAVKDEIRREKALEKIKDGKLDAVEDTSKTK